MEARERGAWANGTRVRLTLRTARSPLDPDAGNAAPGYRVDVSVRPPGEPPEHLTGLPAGTLVAAINERSRYLRALASDPHHGAPAALPRYQTWSITLSGGADEPPGGEEYAAAADALLAEPEVALIAAPDLWSDLGSDESLRWLSDIVGRARRTRDRLVLIDGWSPPGGGSLADPYARLRALGPLREDGRAAAVYFPGVVVADQGAGTEAPTRTVPPSGHVAGVISRFDRERGAHHTPANARVAGAVGLTVTLDPDALVTLGPRGINPLVCRPGRGVLIWGGRTLDAGDRVFLAHERLTHRLVKTIRHVAEPLVFETNGPLLWLALVRAVTRVLFAAWHGGGLAGGQPSEAFRVQCDAETNPPEAVEQGRCTCRIMFAPATPMEHIHLVVTVARDGTMEVA